VKGNKTVLSQVDTLKFESQMIKTRQMTMARHLGCVYLLFVLQIHGFPYEIMENFEVLNERKNHKAWHYLSNLVRKNE
jgi:hypothetical protein